ncbi:MAG TPA: AAA family ATPase [Planctomycetota bacterium]|jgi:chromosome segregation protein|nr:AAA family ATPase [Planctomycetota bacterium]OQC19102.1 MAG: Chromosome partition protein Smc [Planctomycetes bacterium ADurb.Bin069]HNR98968.1 AAA family ATPase [Planctomycetota bacterium]HNU27112.1 AAA family ATPase [Planctomycetota bacterium]HOE30278.1 AAA family ATPase [Planctomycetota bacterium]
MYLKRLTLHGFKSFADRTAFDFSGGMTSIVGPNGCGKSNVVDALKWILGNQSPKEMRGSEMKDVIFAGTTTRRALGFAEVALIFDNEDRRLPTDHAEVAVERRLFRSGESEYRLNGMKCRLKDIRDLFTDTGIGQESYSILEQGKIDLLIQSSPVERRVIFEEAAGISRYRIRREEALRQLVRTEENLARLNDLVAELETRIRGVRIQAGRARRYRELEAELRRLRLRLGWEDLARIIRERAEQETRRNLVHEDIAGMDAEREALQNDLRRWEEERRAAEEERHARAGELGNARGTQQSISETITVTETRIAELTAAGERWAREARDAREAIDQDSGKIAALDAECLGAEAEERATAQIAAAREGELAAVIADLGRGEEALRDARRALVDTLDALTGLRNRHSRVEADSRIAAARLERLRGDEARVREAAALCAAEEAEARNSLAAVAAERAGAEEARARLLADVEREERRLEDKTRQHGETTARLRSLAARRDLLARLLADLDGVNESTRRLIQAARQGALPQVRGLLAEQLGVDAGDARAIESALGPWAQAVIVATREDLDAVRAFLGPDAAFAAICLGAIEAPSDPAAQAAPEPAPGAERDGADCPEVPLSDGVAADPVPGFVTIFDPQPEPLPPPAPASSMPGRVLVDFWAAAFAGEPMAACNCPPAVVLEETSPQAASPACAPAPETVEPARAGAAAAEASSAACAAPVRPSFPHRTARELVACPPELEDAVGAILARTLLVEDPVWERVARCPGWQLVSSSGAVKEPWGGRRWGAPVGVLVRRTELSQCSEEIALLDAVEEELSRRVREQKSVLADLRQSEAAEAAALTRLHGRVEALEETIKHTERRAADLALQRDVFAKESHGLARESAGLEARRVELDGLLRDKERERLAGEQAVTACEKTVSDLREGRRGLEQAIAELRIKEAAATENLRRLREAGDRLRELREERRRHSAEAEEEQARAGRLAALAAGRIEALRAQSAAWERTAAECAAALAAVETRMRTVAAEIREREDALAGLARRHEERRRELADIQLEERELAVKAAHISQGVREEYGIDLDAFARGELEHEELRAIVDPPPESDLRERAADVKDKLARHGNVNLAAIDELTEIEDRYGILAAQRDDLVKAKAHLANVINDLNRKSRRIFAETFDALNKAFGELFRKAFGGGKAELVLEEGKDILMAGIEIIACPPGKKPSHVRLLSGGERTLTTLTLLFAVLRVRPSPFCVLDEVDASLDEANIRRFLVLIDDFTAKTQFLIITHNKLTMVKADRLVGITMEEKGISKMIDVNLRDLEASDGPPERRAAAPALN